MVPVNTLVRINLERGTLSPIQSIREGMKVVTHTRLYQKVTNVLKADYEGELYRIEVVGYSQTIDVTAETQLLVYPNLKILKGIPSNNLLEANRSFDIGWKRALQLDVMDYLQLPAPVNMKQVNMKQLVLTRSKLANGGMLPNSQGMYAKIKSITKVPYSGTLHTLVVENDNSFIVRGLTIRV